MSEIYGQGYGDKHDWKRGETPQQFSGIFGSSNIVKETSWQCKNCGAFFWHRYDEIPDIFEAIKNAGVLEECVNLKKP